MGSLTYEELIEERHQHLMENARLQEESKQLATELKNVNKKLEESETLKSHFISNVTNEIINPFSSILGLSKAILHVEKENWKKVLSMVVLVHSEAFVLDFQFKNIFAAAKIEAGEISPEISNVDVYSLIKSMIDSFTLVTKRKRIIFKYLFDVENTENNVFYFKTDAEKLKLILSNLLSNAIKFSHDDGVVIIHVCTIDSELVISVQDNGIGISDINSRIIFDRFKRVDSGISSVNRGHGLGLSINKALLDILDGEITFQSELGNGANFTIRLPEANEDSFSISTDGNELFFDDNQVF
jgi:signal transduction histidine kinase